MDQYFTNAVEKNATLSIGTKKNYAKAMNHLKKFLESNQKTKILVRDLNSTMAIQFKDYLLSLTEHNSKAGMKEISALSIVKKLRTLFNRAVEENILIANPFRTIKLKSRYQQKPRLSLHQIKELMSLDLSQYKRLEPYRDLFLFCSLTGLAYEDAHRLNYSNIVLLPSGLQKLQLNREKTSVLTEVFLLPQAIAIIEKYRSNPENKILRRVLPQRSNQKINDNLKLLSILLKLPFALSSHIARHSYRQLLGEAGITDMAVIKRMMGQTRHGEIDDVYYSVTESRLIEAFEKF